jgi:general stress protein 26
MATLTTIPISTERPYLWFFTRASSAKVDEVGASQVVNLSYEKPGSEHYVSVSGRAQIVKDRSMMEKLWIESMRTWFPKGLDDPELALIQVTVLAAEYWDAPSSAMVHAYGYVKSLMTGKAPKPGDNQKLVFNPSQSHSGVSSSTH